MFTDFYRHVYTQTHLKTCVCNTHGYVHLKYFGHCFFLIIVLPGKYFWIPGSWFLHRSNESDQAKLKRPGLMSKAPRVTLKPSPTQKSSGLSERGQSLERKVGLKQSFQLNTTHILHALYSVMPFLISSLEFIFQCLIFLLNLLNITVKMYLT